MILGIESSCDESALALLDPRQGLVSEQVYSQIATHQEYGGIVPDLASREHLDAFPVLLKELNEKLDLGLVDRIAVTSGPGLASCLALGISMARSLALALGVPLVGVNHLRGHAFSPFIGLHAEDPAAFEDRFEALLPHLGLIVSGGNSVLFVIGKDRVLRVLGGTVDDAAGEALDKGAKLMGLAYPGGPLIEKLAHGGDVEKYDFPRGFATSPEIKFSFSGLKTSLRYTLEAMDDATLEQEMPNLCASYQKAVVDALVTKVRQCMKKHRYASFGLSGGVANNKALRGALSAFCDKRNLPCLIAQPKHTGDNAGMIAFAAFADAAATVKEGDGLAVNPSWKL